LWRYTHTIRFKLTCLYLFVFGGIVAALCGLILAVRERDIRADLDSRLEDRARAILDTIPPAADRTRGTGLPRLDRIRPSGYLFQVRLDDGTVAGRSASLGERTLPMSDDAAATRARGGDILETILLHPPGGVEDTSDPVRLLTTWYAPSGEAPYYLQVGRNLGTIHQSIRSLRSLLLFAVSGGLLAAALASWILARRSLAPIARFAEQAKRLSVENLDERIEQPPGRDEVATMVATLNDLLGRLAAAFHAQERFVADVSHELKTPLTVLLSEAQVLMQQRRSPEDYDRFLASVQDEARTLAQIVDSLLTLARADAGFTPGIRADVSVNEVVMDAIERWQPYAAQREVRLVPILALPAEDDPPLIVMGDGELLRLMIGNLLRNALGHSPVEQPVEVEVQAKDGSTVIAVRDRGPGVPEEDLDRIFERFYRTQTDVCSPAEGMGLGLTIARGVARLHGGTVAAANRPGGGAEFTVTLPLASGRTL